MSNGLVIGKFMPPTKGHEFLVNFAKNLVDVLEVQVGTLNSEPIDGYTRFNWMRNNWKHNPKIQFVWNNDENPQYPEEHSDFWQIWHDSIFNHKVINGKYDYVFASENYGFQLAETLGATFIPVDINREHVPISATKIRSNPEQYWNFLLPSVKDSLTQIIVITGSESVGKTTMCKNLAQHYNTVWVPEYARIWLEATNTNMNFKFEDLDLFVKGQVAAINAQKTNANIRLFVDTDPIITKIYSEIYFGKVSDVVEQYSKLFKPTHYIVLAPTVPWINDVLRDLPNERQSFFDKLIKELEETKISYTVIEDEHWDVRLNKTIEAISQITLI